MLQARMLPSADISPPKMNPISSIIANMPKTGNMSDMGNLDGDNATMPTTSNALSPK